MASEGLHESADRLDEGVIDRHRAITSIMEELEAVDWYDQRVAATADPSLAEVLGHNRDEEKEHAAMTIEWLRRHDPVLDKHLRTYLFTDGSITEIEYEAEHESGDAEGSSDNTTESTGEQANATGSLDIGSLHGKGSL